MPHANGVDEVMQQAREKAAAAKPPLTEEERLTVEEARKVLEEKAEILKEAVRERDGLEAESKRLRAELEKLEAVCAAREKTIRLDAESQALLDQRDAILERAEKEKRDILAAAEREAGEQTRLAVSGAEQIRREAEEAAGQTAREIRAQAEAEARDILDAARAEERKIVEAKERTAQLREEAILARAEEFERRARASAAQYEREVQERARKEAEEIVAAGEAVLESRKESLDQREAGLNEWEAALPGLAEQTAAGRTAAMKAALEAQSSRLAERQAALEIREEEADYLSRALQEEKRLFEQRLEEAVAARHTDLQNELKEKKKTATTLSDTNRKLHEQLDELTVKARQIQAERGGEALLEKKQRLEAECGRLRDHLKFYEMNGITPERVTEITGQRSRIEDLEKQVQLLTSELEGARRQASVSIGAADELSEAQGRLEHQKQTIQELLDELNQRRQISRDEMLRPIREVPAFLDVPAPETDPEDLAEEDRWLEHIRRQAGKSGIIFSQRQLLAYHTCLKINEWSPMVVLSGVSGTGKSELPKQYAVHGGMQFLSLPVKPDWDSPASLFGYYNSIENKFEATELIRTLYQMQRSQKSRWSQGMLMVLLDEMNLAHPEQYFADLLSKFEEARNSEKDPMYEVVLGAGEPSLGLDIGRNVLWTGTMNEDETTKGLSDKVIDRSMLITFPCPKELYDRDSGKMAAPELTLSFRRWNEWKDHGLSKDSEQAAEALTARKSLIQQVNLHLSAMGRNLGHRVWQSIQNYILNYPPVILAARGEGEMEPAVQQAFCDALAFKMMPKLRGLEVRGQNEDHIEAIRRCLIQSAPELLDDFDSACRLTSEVFQWHSAEFMGL